MHFLGTHNLFLRHLQVSQDLPFLHPSEISVLNRLCKLGSDYIRFTEFIEQHTGHVHPQVSPKTFIRDDSFLFDCVLDTVSLFSNTSLLCRSITAASPARPGFMGFTCGLSARGWTPCCSPTGRSCWTSNRR